MLPKTVPILVQNLGAMMARPTLARGTTSKAAQCLPFSPKTLTKITGLKRNTTGH
jgi:hypothetical protein